MSLLRKLRTYARLGPLSLARVALYRAGLKMGVHPVHGIRPRPMSEGAIFPVVRREAPAAAPSPAWAGGPWAFGLPAGEPTDSPPLWHSNIITGVETRFRDQRWDRVPAFLSGAGDIKSVWEASRFDWAVTYAQRAVLGDQVALRKLNVWLADWVAENPAYLGPNWMCGQEASIRVLHLAISALIMGAVDAPSAALQDLLITHLRRIQPTLSYALGQDNNHATSEGAALFVGGAWLAAHGTDPGTRAEADSLSRAGRRLLDQSVARLVFEDGGFSQYSIVYHRIMLDALSIAELYRRRLELPPFAVATVRKLGKAAVWLDAMIDDASGDAPNMGANDGAWLLPVGAGSARDFRPSAALASALFRGSRIAVQAPSVQDMLTWLEVDTSTLPEEGRAVRQDFAESGMVLLQRGLLRGWLRVPRFRFRPSQADALHLDIWFASTPLFVDSGSYSYADPTRGGGTHFGSVAAHNTVQFDDRDQMPRLSRFLFGDWLDAAFQRFERDHVRADYSDYRKATHRREVRFEDDRAVVTDDVEGFDASATLRWRSTLPLQVSGATATADLETGGRLVVRFSVNGNPVAPRIVDGEVSRFYLRTEPVKVLEVSVTRPSRIVTEIFVQAPVTDAAVGGRDVEWT